MPKNMTSFQTFGAEKLTVRVTVRLIPSEAQLLRLLARQTDPTPSGLIREILRG